ncbi:LysR substrate-binding domain-containing protein [Halovulum sp. GXIMD14794]
MDRQPTLKQLRYFVALAEAGHYRRAAELVGISQPSLSLQIANLEETLGLRLVERGRAGAVLTPAGREVLARAQSILSEVSLLTETSERLTQGLAGTFRLGASATLGPYLLPSVVRELHQGYPSLRLFISDGAPRDLEDDLLAGRHDIILTQLPIRSSETTVARLFREPLRLAVARDHRLAAATRVSDADLAEESLLTLSSRFTLHAQISEIAHEVGANLRQDYEGTSLDAIRQMVAMNMGVAFLPALYVHSEIAEPDGDVALVPFRPGRFTRSIGLVWRKTVGNSAGFAELAEVIRSVTRDRFAGLVQLEAAAPR